MNSPGEIRQPFASVLLATLYFAAVVSPATVAVLAVPQTDHSLLSEIAKNCGLVGIGILLFQFVLAGRLRWICDVFSLSEVMLFHRSMGLLAIALLLLHPVLLAAGEGDWSLIYGWSQPLYIWAGKLGLLALITHIVVSVFRTALKLSYEHWRMTHDVLAVAIIGLTLVHGWFAGGDLQTWPMQLLWILLGGAAISVLVWHRWIRPMKLASQPMRVVEVRQETPDVWTLRLAGVENWTADHLPGQFQFLTFPDSWAVPPEEHHFTIASSPTAEGYVESTIKASGDFTRKIQSIEPDDPVIVHKAFGHFSYLMHANENAFVFVAGGIAVTPLMSMLRHMRDTGSQKHVRFLFANKTAADIVFADELAQMQATQSPPLTLTHVLSNADESWSGERGHIDAEKIERLLGEIESTTGVYVCGPAAMTKQVIEGLQDRGVSHRQIHTESFSLAHDTAPTSAGSLWRRRLTVATALMVVVLVGAVALWRADGASAGNGHQHSHGHSHSSSDGGSQEDVSPSEETHDHAAE
ncbi:ferredoxin reductase family protein [Rhodopirellula europaea]|uniref:Oxidoreductase FAD/NAD(P)-binding domain protein n=1 Tax=Rhodopirellula europaea SH398 TaxID=1263868 RepID=M5SBN5_9BACT|nr:ferredoxin reductase family protein [Rhodopirellula europaea]EMI29068.1 oxidoreductase FAD/NAD(P)-binding domain protein [Rhodopirellula europaea SH398]